MKHKRGQGAVVAGSQHSHRFLLGTKFEKFKWCAKKCLYSTSSNASQHSLRIINMVVLPSICQETNRSIYHCEVP
jgi:hypothetical protein